MDKKHLILSSISNNETSFLHIVDYKTLLWALSPLRGNFCNVSVLHYWLI